MVKKKYMESLITAGFYNCLFYQNHSKNKPQTATYGSTSLSNGIPSSRNLSPPTTPHPKLLYLYSPKFFKEIYHEFLWR